MQPIQIESMDEIPPMDIPGPGQVSILLIAVPHPDLGPFDGVEIAGMMDTFGDAVEEADLLVPRGATFSMGLVLRRD